LFNNGVFHEETRSADQVGTRFFGRLAGRLGVVGIKRVVGVGSGFFQK